MATPTPRTSASKSKTTRKGTASTPVRKAPRQGTASKPAGKAGAGPARKPQMSPRSDLVRLGTADLVMGRQLVEDRIKRGELHLLRPVLHPAFKQRIADKSGLQRLIDNPPRLEGTASRHLDGRHQKVVVVSVHDPAGATRSGVPVQLRHGDRIVDWSVTNREGAAVLIADTQDVDVTVGQVRRNVEWNDDHALVHFVTEEEFEIPAERPADPFDRLPADFHPSLCNILPQYLGMRGHQLLQNPMDPQDFRSHRNRLIKRFTVPRTGDGDGGPPRRYLVTVRQDWYFLGYTLGELQQVQGLDPGQVVDENFRNATHATVRTAQSHSNTIRRNLAEVQNTLSRISSVDSLVDVATQAHTQLDVNGYAKASAHLDSPGLLGHAKAAIFGGSIGGSAGIESGTSTTTDAWTSALTRTNMDTSLYVNNLMRSAQSQVNQVVRTAVSMLRDAKTDLTRTVGQVSPLLSKVTNLLRWSVYENYAVCTHVEDIVEIQSIAVVDASNHGVLFPAEDIVEYRRYFERGLLEPRLRPHFDTLARAVSRERSADMPVKSIEVLCDYTAQIAGAELRCRLGRDEERVRLEPGGHQAHFHLELTEALLPDELPDMKLDLFMDDVASGPVVPDFLKIFGGDVLDKSTVRVSRMRLRYRTGGIREHALEQDTYLGNQLRTHANTQHTTHNIDLQVPRPAELTQYNPLFIHINRNRTHYMGLLMQAALHNPGLRDDAWQLAAFDADHALWRLPILGFEGDRVLVVGSPDPKDAFAKKLLADPGAGSLVQVAAPGAYSEALEGLLSLADAAGRIHPALEPPVPAQLPVALVDIKRNGHVEETVRV